MASSSEPLAKRITLVSRERKSFVPSIFSKECSICNEPARFGCLYCNDSSYCSLKCLGEGELTHGRLCQQLVDFTSSFPEPEASENHMFYLGFIFKEELTLGQFAWVECESSPEEPFKKPDFMLGNDVSTCSIRNFHLDESRKEGWVLKLLSNETKGSPEDALVALKVLPEGATDIAVANIENLATWRTKRGIMGVTGVDQQKGFLSGVHIHNNNIRGVEIQRYFNVASNAHDVSYKQHLFTWGSDIFVNGKVSQFSQLLNIPILCQPGPPTKRSELNVDPHWSPFAPALPYSIYLVRKDGKELTYCQVRAMSQFYIQKLISKTKTFASIDKSHWADLWHKMESTKHDDDCRVMGLKHFINAEAFKEFFQNFKEEQIRQGKTYWVHEVSPCDI